jgi:DNA-binding SARP family transcriptional activator
MPDLTHDLIRQQIAMLESQTKLVVVHPGYLSQHLVLPHFWIVEACCYLRVEPTDVTRRQLSARLTETLKQQGHPHDLNSLELLILDDGDVVADSELESFLTDILSTIGGRILFLSRRLPAFVRTNSEIRRQTQIIPHDAGLLLPEYAQHAEGSALLEVRTFGQGRVLLNGRVIDNWDGELPRNLFFFLVDRRMTTRAQIFETFWPNLSAREATNVFHVTKRKISEVLGADLTHYSSGFYRISPEIELKYDVALFNEMLQQSAIEPADKAQALLVRAVWLYRGEFLGQIDSATNVWVQRRRQELTQSYGDALIALAKLAELAGDTKEALGLYIRALATNRQREDLAGIIMGLYRDLGMYEDALQTYDVLAAEIMNMLGISPAQWLQDMAANIRSQQKTIAQPMQP